MQVLDAAHYLGTNVNSFCRDGIWSSVTHYTHENAFDQSLHAHLNPHLTLLLTGGTQEKREEGKYVRVAGDTVFFQAEEPHQNSNTLIGSKNFNLEFTPEFFKGFDLREADLRNAVCLNPDTSFILLKAHYEQLFSGIASADATTMAVLSLVNDRARMHAAPPLWVSLANELMQDRWNEQITLRELSAATGMHPVTISKQFPRYFACTFGEFMRKLKVKRALVLMKDPRYSLSSIAYECGFADHTHFARCFKQLTGFLPKQYRKL
jgi:AraC family transcriptional regulator